MAVTTDRLAAAATGAEPSLPGGLAGVLDNGPERRRLAHLDQRSPRHSLPPSADDTELRHREGQRSVVLYLHNLLATVRRDPSGDLA